MGQNSVEEVEADIRKRWLNKTTVWMMIASVLCYAVVLDCSLLDVLCCVLCAAGVQIPQLIVAEIDGKVVGSGKLTSTSE